MRHALTDDAPGPLHLLDAGMVRYSSELDRLCGYAVSRLRQHARVEVLDVLGMLDPERVAAIYYAVPPGRRAALLKDPAWAYHVHAAGDVPGAMAELDDLLAATAGTDMALVRSSEGIGVV
jgi:hypothetical protein